MKVSKSFRLSTVLLLMVLGFSMQAHADLNLSTEHSVITLETVAASDMDAPGLPGFIFSDWITAEYKNSAPFVNSDGDVAFIANAVTTDGYRRGYGIWIKRRTGYELIAIEDEFQKESNPTTSFDPVIRSYEFDEFSFDDDGRILLFARNNNYYGLWAIETEPLDFFYPIALEGPGTSNDGQFADVGIFTNAGGRVSYMLGGSDDIAFYAKESPDLNLALWLYNEWAEAAHANGPVPGFPGSQFTFSLFANDETYLDRNSNVTFYGSFLDNYLTRYGIWRGGPGTLSLVRVTDVKTGNYWQQGDLTDLRLLDANNNGSIISILTYYDGYAYFTYPEYLVLFPRGSSSNKILAERYKPLPGISHGGNCSFLWYAKLAPDKDLVVMYMDFIIGEYPNSVVSKSIVVQNESGTFTEVASDLINSPSGDPFTHFSNPVVNNNGQVAFLADIDTDVGIKRALFMTDKSKTLVEIVRVGNFIEVLPLDFREVQSIVLNGGMGSPLNDDSKLCFRLFFTDTWAMVCASEPGEPVPDIKANNSDGSVKVPASDLLSVTVELDAGIRAGDSADWWVLADTPFGWYYDNLSSGWQQGMAPIYQGPLFDLPPYEVLNISGLPQGLYKFYFGVDMLMNASLDIGSLYYDSVDVEICVPGTDSDSDRLDDCVETNTGVYAGPQDTGTDPFNPDTDGDWIDDGDEVLGTPGGLDLPGLGADPLRKDIFIEYDWFVDSLDCASHSHKPTQNIVNMVTQAFANSPVSNPDGTTGITIHNDIGQGGLYSGGNVIADADGVLTGDVDGAEFYWHRAANFAPERDGYFHYVILPHRYNTNSDSSGQAELPGDDLIVSTICWYNSNNNVANTIMHELGHNLNLRHGGNTNCNFKPNYNSIMNYRYQFPGIDNNYTPPGDGVRDFSIGDRIVLNENSLDENLGTCGFLTWDWNSNYMLESSVSMDINYDSDYPAHAQTADCGGILTTLSDYNDWANIDLSGLLDADIALRVPKEIITCTNTPD
jgi:hypothetical protein